MVTMNEAFQRDEVLFEVNNEFGECTHLTLLWL